MFIWFPGISLLLTLFCINVLDRFSREQQVRSLAPSPLFSSFPLLSSPRVNYSRTCPADRPTPPPAHFHESRCFRSRVRNRYYGRNTSAGDAGPLDLLSAIAPPNRSEKALPPSRDRLIPRSIPRTFSPPNVHTGPKVMFHFVSFRDRSYRKKEIKGRKKEEMWSSENFEISFRFFFFFFLLYEFAKSTWITRGRRLSCPLSWRGLFPRGCKTEFRKDRECSRNHLPFGTGVEWRLSFLPTLSLPPACLSLPPPRDHRDYTQFTDLRYYRTVFHPLQPMFFIHPLTSPFFFWILFHTFSKSRRSSMKLLTDATRPNRISLNSSFYKKKIIECAIDNKESIRELL